jgi:hypothetical protein
LPLLSENNALQWQEYHQPGGDLIDYKKGNNDPVDPTIKVGTWNISGDSVTYTYGPGSSYTYGVFNDNGNYSFCNNDLLISNVSFVLGNVGCS